MKDTNSLPSCSSRSSVRRPWLGFAGWAAALGLAVVSAGACAGADDPTMTGMEGVAGGPSGSGTVPADSGTTSGSVTALGTGTTPTASGTGTTPTNPGTGATPTDTGTGATSTAPTTDPSATTTGTDSTAPETTAGPLFVSNLPEVTAPSEQPEPYRRLCAACHGQEGEGAALGPELKHIPRAYAHWVTRNGRGFGEHPDFVINMAAFDEASISDMDLALVIAWLGAFPNPTTGEELFGDYCSHCHGDDAASGTVNVDLKTKIAEFSQYVRNGNRPGEPNIRAEHMPSWTAEELTDAEIQLMADWVAARGAGRPRRCPRRGPFTRSDDTRAAR